MIRTLLDLGDVEAIPEDRAGSVATDKGSSDMHEEGLLEHASNRSNGSSSHDLLVSVAQRTLCVVEKTGPAVRMGNYLT